MKLAACVILYCPDKTVIENILSYFNDTNFLFIVDNSDKPLEFDFSFLEENKFEYINNKQNLGIATALNIAADKALLLGFDWLLTMDQDSFFTDGSLKTLKKTLIELQNKNIAIISPIHLGVHNRDVIKNVLYEEVDIVMASGNILNINALKSVGGFNDKLFIDCVDIELCLRFLEKKYLILVVNKAFLNHSLGNFKVLKFFNFTVDVTQHNYVRRYYMTRNRNYIIFNYYKLFPQQCRQLLILQIKEFFKIILFESDKIKKSRSYILGFKDSIVKKYGKYEY